MCPPRLSILDYQVPFLPFILGIRPSPHRVVKKVGSYGIKSISILYRLQSTLSSIKWLSLNDIHHLGEEF